MSVKYCQILVENINKISYLHIFIIALKINECCYHRFCGLFVFFFFYNHLPLSHWEEPIYSTEQSLGVTLINHTVEKSGNIPFSFFSVFVLF